MKNILIKDATLINENRTYKGSVLISGDKIASIYETSIPRQVEEDFTVIPAEGMFLLPGAIDDQVHFREPGSTWKGDIASESRAAAAGGVTSFMDMPNTKPQTTTISELEWKWQRAAETSLINYSFFFGGTNDNIDEIHKVNSHRVPGLKLFLGSSTGNMLVDKKESLERIFGESNMLIAVHAKDLRTTLGQSMKRLLNYKFEFLIFHFIFRSILCFRICIHVNVFFKLLNRKILHCTVF